MTKNRASFKSVKFREPFLCECASRFVFPPNKRKNCAWSFNSASLFFFKNKTLPELQSLTQTTTSVSSCAPCCSYYGAFQRFSLFCCASTTKSFHFRNFPALVSGYTAGGNDFYQLKRKKPFHLRIKVFWLKTSHTLPPKNTQKRDLSYFHQRNLKISPEERWGV